MKQRGTKLKAADYYLFIDFYRPDENPCISIFTHQELALAHHLGFQDIVALQQSGSPLIGFLRYVQSNPEPFADEEELLTKVEQLVRERGWRPDYSRNLVIEEIGFTPLMQYTDHTGSYVETTYQVRVQNRRPDVATLHAVCILDSIIMPDGKIKPSPDRSYLKWAAQLKEYDRTILPSDHVDVDLFSLHVDQGGIFLHSLRDTPREPIASANGPYTLKYKLYAQGFQLVQFDVKLALNWTAPHTFDWINSSSASLIS